MTAFDFMEKYLNKDTIITLQDTGGNILYEGKRNDATWRAFGGRQFVSVEGLGELNDLIITVTKRYDRNGTIIC